MKKKILHKYINDTMMLQELRSQYKLSTHVQSMQCLKYLFYNITIHINMKMWLIPQCNKLLFHMFRK